jgi:hypothetical protein
LAITVFVMRAVALFVVSPPTLVPPTETVVSLDARFVQLPVGIDSSRWRVAVREL